MSLNLVQQRGGSSVWSRSASTSWDVERWIASMAFGALLFAAVRRRSIAGLLMAAGALAWWAVAAPATRRYRRGQLRAVWPVRRTAADASDQVAEASEESFPASDAPSWTPMTGHTGPAPLGGDGRPAGTFESAADLGFFALFPALLYLLALASYFPVETLIDDILRMLGGSGAARRRWSRSSTR